MDIVAAGTLQAELNQPMAPFFIDAPGGRVEVECRGSDFSVEMRGYREDGEGHRGWVGANVTVYLPEFKGWSDRGSIQEASINHSSSSSKGVAGDTEVTIALLQIAVELVNRLNEEADVALAPIRAYFEESRREYERERQERQELQAQQRKVIARYAASGGGIRVFVKGRTNPVRVTYVGAGCEEPLDNSLDRVGTDKRIPISQVLAVEWKSPSGRYEAIAFPTEVTR